MTDLDYLAAYALTLRTKAPGTANMYLHTLRHLTTWIAQLPGSEGQFTPERFTRTALEMYLEKLKTEGYSQSYCTLVKSAASSFAGWLIENEGLSRNPATGLRSPARPLLAPRLLSDDQRYVLRDLVERHADPRGTALFALGYWAGCRVSDGSWLTMENTHLSPRSGWLKVGHKGDKWREIDLLKPARQALDAYLHSAARRKVESVYVFVSQRGARLTEVGIHHWWRTLKSFATKTEWDLIQDLAFHDLRHDFAHRARERGWTLEELAFYLGHITRQGLPAIQTTARYTQVSRQAIQAKLQLLEDRNKVKFI